MAIIDTHAHLYLSDFDTDLEDVFNRALKDGVKKILLHNIDSSYTEKLKKIVTNNKGVAYAMMGIHPSNIDSNYKEQIKHFKSELNTDFNWCAVGEIGIDLYWDQTFFNEQKIAFIEQLEVASELKLPTSIHQRNAIAETLEILNDFKGKTKGILHCFSGDKDDAKKAIDLGYKLGISGVVTFKNSNLIDVIKYSGIDHIVLETDAPFLAPVPFRGKRNEPSFLKYVISFLCQSLNITEDYLINKTYENAIEIFEKIKNNE